MNAIITAVALVVCAGFTASLLLVIASHAFYVPVDERVSEVREILPGANCGGCGFAGCDDYANAVLNDSQQAVALVQWVELLVLSRSLTYSAVLQVALISRSHR